MVFGKSRDGGKLGVSDGLQIGDRFGAGGGLRVAGGLKDQRWARRRHMLPVKLL